MVEPEITGDLETMLTWADEIRRDASRGRNIGVRANADNPEDCIESEEAYQDLIKGFPSERIKDLRCRKERRNNAAGRVRFDLL